MTNIQANKDKATLLQQHLKHDGVVLPRSRALNIIAQLDGYRSHTVAKRGKAHTGNQSKGKTGALVLYTGTYLHPDVEDCYVANQGKHCPYCGSDKVKDARNANADIALWDARMKCDSCGKGWQATYTLDHVDGTADAALALQRLKAGFQDCVMCTGGPVEYSTFVPGQRGYQMASCQSCGNTCVHVYRLSGMSELMGVPSSDEVSDSPRYLVSDSWSHLFGPGSAETEVCFVYDCKVERIVAMAAKAGYKWVECSRAEIADVEDSLKNANEEALDDPESWDMVECDAEDLPDWAKDLMNATAA